MDEPSAAKRPSVLTIDRAAFLLLRVKRAFKKKRQQRKDKQDFCPRKAADMLSYSTHFRDNMGLVVLAFLALLGSVMEFCEADSTLNKTKLDMGSKRTQDLVDEAFLEQKDVLLDMLESKLREVRNKKKKKSLEKLDTLESKSDPAIPKTGELKLTASGISVVGDMDAHLKFGESGKGTLKLKAAGISNVGKSQLDLVLDDKNVLIPGIRNVLGNILSSNYDNQTKGETESELKNPIVATTESRRNTLNNDTVVSDTAVNGTETHDENNTIRGTDI